MLHWSQKKGGIAVPKSTAARLWPLDALRGLAMINMVAYHAMFDWVYVFGQTSSWYDITAPGCHVWQQYICWSFLLLAGYSFTLSRRPLKNGLIVAGCAVLLTVVTVGFLPSESIWFGVLHLVGCAILLCCAARPLLEKFPRRRGWWHRRRCSPSPTSCRRGIWGSRGCAFAGCPGRCTPPTCSGWACRT